jgi:hypothetical protein
MAQEGSFVRWQSFRITQFGVATQLLLTFSTAGLGFVLTRSDPNSSAINCKSKLYVMAAALLFVLSTGLGIACTITRLLDFRKTALIARIRDKMIEKNKPVAYQTRKLRKRRLAVRKLGRCSWRLFFSQAVTFVLGVAVLTFFYF